MALGKYAREARRKVAENGVVVAVVFGVVRHNIEVIKWNSQTTSS